MIRRRWPEADEELAAPEAAIGGGPAAGDAGVSVDLHFGGGGGFGRRFGLFMARTSLSLAFGTPEAAEESLSSMC